MTARVFAPKLGHHLPRKLREQARTGTPADRKRETEIAQLAAEQEMDAAIDAAGGDPIEALFVDVATGASRVR